MFSGDEYYAEGEQEGRSDRDHEPGLAGDRADRRGAEGDPRREEHSPLDGRRVRGEHPLDAPFPEVEGDAGGERDPEGDQARDRQPVRERAGVTGICFGPPDGRGQRRLLAAGDPRDGPDDGEGEPDLDDGESSREVPDRPGRNTEIQVASTANSFRYSGSTSAIVGREKRVLETVPTRPGVTFIAPAVQGSFR